MIQLRKDNFHLELQSFGYNHDLFLRDEKRDFNEEIERLRKLRGKGKRERKPRETK